jgi:hypothetical protein
MVVAEPAPLAPAASAKGRMVILVGNDRRVIVDAGVDAAALARVLEVLGRRCAAGVRIWIATGHTDMRNGMEGLALLVQEGLGRYP